MAKPKWTTKPAELSAVVDADGGFTVKIPLYDNGVKQGTMVWTMSSTRSMTIVLEQIADTAPIDFGGGAWVKVV